MDLYNALPPLPLCTVFTHTLHFSLSCASRAPQERPPAEPSPAAGPLSQLLSPQCPALLLVVQAWPGPDRRYGFSCCSRGAGQGLVVTQSDHSSQLCPEDRSVPHSTQCPLENNASSVLPGGARSVAHLGICQSAGLVFLLARVLCVRSL